MTDERTTDWHKKLAKDQSPVVAAAMELVKCADDEVTACYLRLVKEVAAYKEARNKMPTAPKQKV